MKAEIKPSYDTNRSKLSDIIPLNSPFTVFIEPTRYCNFKCFYCLHSTKGNEDDKFRKIGYQLKNMDFELYEKIINDLLQLPEQPKRIVFSGLGEPLMNPKLIDMISLARKLGVADRIDILTNASLITPDISDALIESGVSRIQISLQGLSAYKYREVCGTDIDFEKFKYNLKYLYENRGQTSIFIKIIDTLLENEAEEEIFFNTFGNICDQIFIEHLITLQPGMGDHDGKADNSRNLNNEKVIYRHVCPVIFYLLQVDVEGNVFPCPVSGLPVEFSIGNVYKDNISEIWNSNKRNNLIRSHLMFNRKKIPTCGTCQACSAVLDKNEFIDDEAETIIDRFLK